MLTELILFLSCFGLGVLGRFWYKGLIKIETKIGRAAAVTLEFISVGMLAAAFVSVMLFLGGGIFKPFMPIGVAIGFAATSIFF